MSGLPLDIEQRDGVTILRLARPEQRNALTPEMREALSGAIEVFAADPGAGCLLITGMGDSFCAGGDLRGFSPGQRPHANRDRIRLAQSWVLRLMSVEKPVIMAVNGAAAGAGFGLALAGDVLVAGARAYFQPAFPLVGMVPDMGLAKTLPQAVGGPRARDILLTNRRVEADEALGIGLVSRVFPDEALFDEALAIARRLAAGPRVALALSKSLLAAGQEMDMASFAQLEAAFQGLAMGSADHEEGVTGFMEKRRPAFTGG